MGAIDRHALTCCVNAKVHHDVSGIGRFWWRGANKETFSTVQRLQKVECPQEEKILETSQLASDQYGSMFKSTYVLPELRHICKLVLGAKRAT